METLTTLRKETISGLEDLVRINVDSAKGFGQAAECIDNKALADFFRQCGAQRREFADALQRPLEMNDEEASDVGSIKAAVHRWWIGMRAKVASDDVHAMLSEAERGEDVIKARYEEVLKDTAGSPLNAIVQSQYASVKQCHDRIRDMRDACK